MSLIPLCRYADRAEKKRQAISLLAFLTRLIWLCVLPLVLLSIYLAINHVRTLQTQRDDEAQHQVRNVATAIDRQVGAQISALQVLAASPLVDDPPRLQEFYNEARAFRESFGGYVILADLSLQMLFYTREPFGAVLPQLPRPRGHAAAPTARETGKPAVGDMFIGPVAKEPLVAVVVPVIRDGRVTFLLLSIVETRQFQQRLDEVSLPEGFSLTLLDGKGEVMARRVRPEIPGLWSGEDPPGRFVANSAVSHWSVVLDVPRRVYRTPLIAATAALVAAILAATLVSVLGGRLASRRLASSVAALASTTTLPAERPVIGEIEAVRCMLVEAAAARDEAESIRLESERRFRQLFDIAPVPLCFVDKDGVLVNFNARFTQAFGYDHADVATLADWWQQAYPDPDYRFRAVETWEAAVGRARKNDADIEPVEYLVTCKNGEIRTVLISGTLLGDNFLAVFFDITERKRAEEALQESEQRYRATFNIASVGIDLVDGNGQFLEVNSTLSQFLGYTPEELRRLTITDVTHPEDVSRSRDMHEAMVQGTTEGYRLEKRYVRKDGSILWADAAVSAIRDADGKHRATVGVISDITQRKQSEEARIRLEAAVEQAAETVEITDAQGIIVYVNPSVAGTTGYSREELVGNNPRILKSGHHDEEFYQRMWNTITHGKIWTGHLINKKKDGTLFEEDVSISPVKDYSGEIVNYVAVKRDVTREVSLQRQLLQAQKMEAIGTLAGGMAHDFNNILQVILGYSELLLTEKSEKEQDFDDLQKIQHAARSGADLVRNLLTFSRKLEPKPVPMDLNKQVRDVEKLLHRTIPRMIDIRVELKEGLKRIDADPSQMVQIIMNLAVNAKDAMGEKGTLTITTDDVVLDEEICRVNAESRPGDYVLLSVADTGHGMDRETLQHIFEPFYTTKELGRGTGLGLAMVYGIVKQHYGLVTCSSEVGRGTAFRVYLPALSSEPQHVEETTAEIPSWGTETLLLVDDEDFVRELGRRILTGRGYTVLTAPNGEEALSVYRSQQDRISLIVLDLMMPGMGGKDCLKELLEVNPDATVLIASGYATDAVTKECMRLGAKGFVSKPFGFKQLLQRVRDTLNETCHIHRNCSP